MLPNFLDYRHLNKTYFDSFGESLGFFDATIYDSCWILALSVIESGSLDTSSICEVLPTISSYYCARTGNCHFDLVGDRDELDMEFWGYLQQGEKVTMSQYGSYFASNNTIRWEIE
jgi:hypothetical protein